MKWFRGRIKAARGAEARNRYQQTQNPADLDTAIDLMEQAVPLFHAGEMYRVRAASELIDWLMMRYLLRKDLDDLTRAASHARALIETTPVKSPLWPGVIQEVSHTLVVYAQIAGDRDALDEVIEHVHAALSRIPDDSPLVQSLENALGNALLDRYRIDMGKAPDDLDESVAAHDRALAAPASNPHSLAAQTLRGTALGDLSAPLLECYVQSGEIADLERAKAALEEALTLIPIRPARSLPLTNLGIVHSLRFTADGDLVDLERALECHREALVDALPAQLGIIWRNLAGTLSRLAEERDSREILDQSLEAYEQAITFAQGDMMMGSAVNGLSSQLARVADHLSGEKKLDMLARAVDMAGKSLKLTPETSLFHAGRLHNYGNRVVDYWQAGDQDDVDALKAGLTALAQAVRATSPRSPEYPRYLNTLATALRELPTESPEVSRQLRRHYRAACHAGLRNNLAMAFTAGQNWGTWALRQHRFRDAAVGLGLAMRAMERLLEAQFLRQDKEDWLRQAQNIPANYAYVLAKRGLLTRAIEILEKTRTRLLSASLERMRVDLERLPELGHGELLQRYVAASAVVQRIMRATAGAGLGLDLDGGVGVGVGIDVRGHAASRSRVADAEDARAKVEALERIVGEIRAVPGFEDVFAPPALSAIHQALSPNPETVGVYLVSSPAGSLALMLHNGTIEPIWLNYTHKQLIDALYDQENGLLGPQAIETTEMAYLSSALNQALPTIGEQVVAPIAAALRVRFASAADGGADQAIAEADTDDDDASRRTLVLITTGSWGLIPLHAAPYDNTGRCLLDDCAVRYAPSARALIHTSPHDRDTSGDDRHAFIGVSDPTGDVETDRLAHARTEVREIADLFAAAGADPMILSDADATIARVTAALEQTDCLHLACHGTFDVLQPLQSGLQLKDGTLSAQALLTAQLRSTPRLVVSSACRSSLTDPFKLPEEAIGLPAVFLEIGCTAVIGSLWSVDDETTSLLMRKLYALAMNAAGLEGSSSAGTSSPGPSPRAPSSAAHALRRAQLWLRTQPGCADAVWWAAFTYQGHDVTLTAPRHPASPSRRASGAAQA